MITRISGTGNFWPQGEFEAYTIGADACNLGNQEVQWQACPATTHPVFGGTLLLALAVAFLARDAAATRQAAPAVNDSLLAPVLTVSDSAALKGPRQPIFFRHDIHAGQFKINCQYCHYSVSVSSE